VTGALKRAAIAISTGACVALLPFGWSEQHSSLGIESAQARTNRASRPIFVAEDARHTYRRSGSGVYGRGLYAAAVAATTSAWNYDDYYCAGDSYAGRGYPPGSYYYRGYPGGYCVSAGYASGLYTRPTLAPRFYGGW